MIFVADQGVDLNHSELQGALELEPHEDWNFVVDSSKSPHEPSRFHGTAIAGIIAAQHNSELLKGVAPECKVFPVKLYHVTLNTFTLRKCIRRVRQYAKRNPDKRIVLNFSLEVSDSEAVEKEIGLAISEGIVIVASAGNAALFDRPHYPSDYQGVLSVGAVGPDDLFADDYSNYGSRVDVVAPGGKGKPSKSPSNLLVIAPRNRSYYSYGTSFSAPYAAAVAALVLAKAKKTGRQISSEDVVKIIKDSAKSIDNLNPNYAGYIGRGRIDAKAALDLV